MLITRSCLLGLVSVPATWLVAAWLALTLANGNAPDRACIELVPAADGRWQATYTFTEPVEELHFARAARFHRETVWQVTTPGYAFARRDGRQLLVRETGAVPARVVRFEIPVHTDNLEKDYALFAAFTDGSVAIYTGHFHAAATAAGTAPEAVSETEFVRDFRLMPAPGMAVVAGGRRLTGPVDWHDRHRQGTFAYFGAIEPVVGEHLLAIVDPGLPDWIRTRLERELPRLFEVLTRGFGVPLQARPVVLVGYDPEAADGTGSAGGVLPDLVQLRFAGDGWSRESPERTEALFYLLAHESVHLWNGNRARNTEDDHAWLHEGSADHVAWFTLHALGLIDDERLQQARAEALNACLQDLTGMALQEAAANDRFGAYYSCGQVVSMWVQAALERVRASVDPFLVWRRVLEQALADDGDYDRGTFHNTLAELGVAPAVRADLREFTETRLADPAAFLEQRLSRVGVRLRPRPDAQAPARYRADYGFRALTALMAADCGGAYSVTRHDGYAVTGALENCQVFRHPQEVVALNGHNLIISGHQAYDALVAACTRGEALRIGLRDGAFLDSEKCTAAQPPRKPWLDWEV